MTADIPKPGAMRFFLCINRLVGLGRQRSALVPILLERASARIQELYLIVRKQRLRGISDTRVVGARLAPRSIFQNLLLAALRTRRILELWTLDSLDPEQPLLLVVYFEL